MKDVIFHLKQYPDLGKLKMQRDTDWSCKGCALENFRVNCIHVQQDIDYNCVTTKSKLVKVG